MVMLTYFPLIIWAGAALLGWIAGDVVATDTVVANYAASFGPAMPEKVKLVCSILGVAATLGAGIIGRARLTRHA
jgi:uncharacterized membrane protein